MTKSATKKQKNQGELVEKLKPAKNQKIKSTYIAFVLDESGSMARGYDLTMKTFNDQLNIIRKNEADGGKTRISFYTFADNAKCLYSAESIQQAKDLNREIYRPQGGTALYDCIGLALKDLKAIEEQVKDTEDAAFLISVFTDGEENASKFFKGAELHEELKALQDQGNWTATLMGPDTGLAMLSDILGIKSDNVAGFNPGSIESRTFAGAKESLKMSSYMSARSANISACASLYAGIPGALGADES